MAVNETATSPEARLFQILAVHSGKVVEAAEALVALMDDFGTLPEAKKRVKAIEHEGDEKVHELFAILRGAVLKPSAQRDVTGLARALDDVLDFTWATVNHLALYEVPAPTPDLKELAGVLRDQVASLHRAMQRWEDPEARPEVEEAIVEVHRLENQADEVTDRAVAALFKQEDVKFILKMKDVYDNLELATDKCEDAADALRDLLAKHS